MKKLLKYTEKIKHLPRTGWLHHGIETPESVASHSWQMALMAMQLSGIMLKESYDFDKIIRMCLCHDLAESLIGDITPRDTEYAAKKEKELQAIDFIAEDGDIPEIIFLFREYEKGETREALLARDLDQLDMYAQSYDYEKKYPDKDLSEFRETAISKIKTSLGRAILKDITPK